MTIKEFYEWAVEHGVENYDFHSEYEFDMREIDLEIRDDFKTVII